MRAHVIEGGKVVNTIEVVSIESMPGMTLVDADVGGQIGDLWDGEQFSAPLAMPSEDDYVIALEAHYDARAKERRYDNRLTCALRAGYAGPFQAEGAAFAVWMDTCNALAYQIMGAVLAGTRAQPTIDELIAELPALEWPA